MGDNFLSQEEIDSLLKKNREVDELNEVKDAELSFEEKGVMEEVGRMTMSASAAALSSLAGREVRMDEPEASEMSFGEFAEGLKSANLSLQFQFRNGLSGSNVLLMDIADASVIANLIMGGDGRETSGELSEMELSAVTEAMKQMIGKASTAISGMISKAVEIDLPLASLWNKGDEISIPGISNGARVIRITSRLFVEDLIDSEIMQLYTLDAAREICGIMLEGIEGAQTETPYSEDNKNHEESFPKDGGYGREYKESEVRIQEPAFAELRKQPGKRGPRNIELILDVPLELSVVLGRTKMSIKDILALEPGSIVELNKLAEEPLEIYVNGKHTALGEVVVVDEKFGIRITDILSAEDRVRKLG